MRNAKEKINIQIVPRLPEKRRLSSCVCLHIFCAHCMAPDTRQMHGRWVQGAPPSFSLSFTLWEQLFYPLVGCISQVDICSQKDVSLTWELHDPFGIIWNYLLYSFCSTEKQIARSGLTYKNELGEYWCGSSSVLFLLWLRRDLKGGKITHWPPSVVLHLLKSLKHTHNVYSRRLRWSAPEPVGTFQIEIIMGTSRRQREPLLIAHL